MKKSLAMILIMLLVVSGCGAKLREGEVYDKEFTPAHTAVMLIPVVRSNGKTSTTTLVPYIYYYPDDWSISIKGQMDGEEKTATYHVTEDVYDACVIGSQFIYDEEFCSDSAAYTRERK